jgi:hypothetical protein
MTARKLISFDWAIKKILRGKVNFEILEGFLSELLQDKIKIIEILENKINKVSREDNFNYVLMTAKTMKEAGMDAVVIAQMTGLSIKKIGGLS